MSDWSADDNPYEVLGLPLESTKEQHKKRYRKLALEKHPDKQPGNKRAAEEFIKLQRAFEILSDDKAREAWDNLQRAKNARQAKHAGQSQKRRKMAEDLERRERVFEVERSQEKAARNKLQAELARLRKSMVEREEQKQAQLFQERISKNLSEAVSSASHTAHAEEQIQRTLKVSWDDSISTYPAEELRDLFTKHGEVQDVIPRPLKKKTKGSALIVMAALEGARRAADNVSGNLDNPLLVVPLAKNAPPARNGGGGGMSPLPSADIPPGNLFPRPAFPSGGSAGTSSFTGVGLAAPPNIGRPLFASFQPPGPASQPSNGAANTSSNNLTHSSFEEGVFAKMRRKAELDQQAKQQPH